MVAFLHIIIILFLLTHHSLAFKYHSRLCRRLTHIRACPESKTKQEAVVQSPQVFLSKKQFNDLNLSEKLVEVIRSLGLENPSKIQAIAAHGVQTGRHCIIADQTGSGKTLSYLLPTIQRMLFQKPKHPPKRSSSSPFLLVLTPTTELTLQVTKVVKELANALKFRTVCLTSVSDMDSEKKKLRVGADVVVSTPGRLLQLLERKEVDLSQVQVVVLDEADVLLMDESFPLQPIGQACSWKSGFQEPHITPDQDRAMHTNSSTSSGGAQFIFVTATLPDIVVKQIHSEFPDVMTLTGPGLHRIAPSVEEVLIDCSGPPSQSRSLTQIYANKRKELIRALASSQSERTIVFCNTIDQCRRVENILERSDRDGSDRDVYCYHSAVDPKTRDANLREFCRPLLRQPAVLVCTDRASRGMDFGSARVDHVILFDFPQEPSEYLRRVGRTGRAGRGGKASILVYGKQLPAARAVIRSSREGGRIQPSDNL